MNAEILERLRELSEIQPSNPHFKVLQGLIREVESTIEKDDEVRKGCENVRERGRERN